MIRRLYADTNFLIAFVESKKPFSYLDVLAERGELFFATSELTLSELLVLPYREDDRRLIDEYEAMFRQPDFLETLPVSRDILRAAARIRAQEGGRTPDAIHLASAQALRCDVFLSSDRRLHMPPGIRRIGIDEIDNPEAWPT